MYPKPQRRDRAAERARILANRRDVYREVDRRAGLRCERCGKDLLNGGGEHHHLAGRGHKGSGDTPDNVVLLCSVGRNAWGKQPCHQWAHAHPEEARAKGWMRSRHQP